MIGARNRAKDKRFSLRQVSARVGIVPSHLSRDELGEAVSLSKGKIIPLAGVL